MAGSAAGHGSESCWRDGLRAAYAAGDMAVQHKELARGLGTGRAEHYVPQLMDIAESAR